MSIKVFLDWEKDGLELALKNNHIVAIVDVLSFSSVVVTAISNGFTIYPISDQKQGEKLANKLGAEMSGSRGKSRFSLSPQDYIAPSDIKTVVLRSPNGAALSELVKDNDLAFIGCFLNAKALANNIETLAKNTGRNISIIAANEQRAVNNGERVEYLSDNTNKVFALEDYLGCGAIISELPFTKSPEATVCQSSFYDCKDKLHDLLSQCFSGQYLIQKDFGQDVKFCSQLNWSDFCPRIKDGKIGSYSTESNFIPQ